MPVMIKSKGTFTKLKGCKFKFIELTHTVVIKFWNSLSQEVRKVKNSTSYKKELDIYMDIKNIESYS